MTLCKSIVLSLIWAIPFFGTQAYANQHPDTFSRPLTIADYDKLISHYRYLKPDSAIYYTQKAITLAKKNKDDIGLAKILNQLGMIQDNLGKFDESRESYLQSKALYERTGQQKGVATEIVRLGVIESRKGNYDKATAYFLDALRLSEKNNNLSGKMESYLTLSEVYMFQNKVDTALTYLKQAEQINQVIPFSNLSLNIYNNFGVLYRETGEYDKARDYLEKGLALSNKPELQGLNITLTNTLAALYAKQGFKAKSIALQKTALAKARAINNYIREYQTLMNIAETYGTDNAAQALVYFNQALAKVKAKGAQKQAIQILGRVADMYHYMGNDKQAYLAKQEEYAIAEKYYFQSMAKQIVSLQAGYELSRSKASVQSLQYINARQALESRIILGIGVGAVLVMIIAGLFYFRTSKLNKLLNTTNAQLQESNTVKDKLFSVLAHDLRSPFATIISLLHVINDDDLPADERKELIDLVSVTSNASLDILNNLLKWGEMQIKGIRLQPVNLDPIPIIDRNIAMLSGAAEIKSIHLQKQISPGTLVVTDPDHFDFILRNLLSNAVKFTPQGGTVTVSSTTNEQNNEVQFIVQDNGVGIDPERIGLIFNMSNVSTDGTNDEKGTSLGLVLCKEFVEANHGHIWVESQPGEGSRFIFSLKKA